MTPEQAKASGYCITSRSGRHATRIDRKNWREYMAARHCPWSTAEGLEWVACLGKGAADQYRRVYSKDTIVVPESWLKILPNSGSGPSSWKVLDRPHNTRI